MSFLAQIILYGYRNRSCSQPTALNYFASYLILKKEVFLPNSFLYCAKSNKLQFSSTSTWCIVWKSITFTLYYKVDIGVYWVICMCSSPLCCQTLRVFYWSDRLLIRSPFSKRCFWNPNLLSYICMQCMRASGYRLRVKVIMIYLLLWYSVCSWVQKWSECCAPLCQRHRLTII